MNAIIAVDFKYFAFTFDTFIAFVTIDVTFIFVNDFVIEEFKVTY